jgi:hypothetical protein
MKLHTTTIEEVTPCVKRGGMPVAAAAAMLRASDILKLSEEVSIPSSVLLHVSQLS